MATQLSMFGEVGKPIGSSIFDPVIPAASTGAMGPAQRSAMVFMQNQSKKFALPSPAPGPRSQMAFDFAGSTAKAAKKFPIRKLVKGGLIEGVIGAGYIFGATVAGGISGSSRWGSATGLEEDYVGGAVAGTVAGFTGSAADVAGGFAGGAIGAGIGSMIAPGVGTIVGGIIGGIAGSIGGNAAGNAMFGGVAQNAGLAARAIVRTARAVDTVQFGGNFVDSRAAYTMRQRAVQDMSGSMLNARQFLGNEAIFLHER
jgi:hypothetical protein